MRMDAEYKKLVEKFEKPYSEFAKKSTKCLGRKHFLEEDAFRAPFERDCHRILHSLPFRRLKHKTQVFFAPKDDHICTRMEHSLHVASISSTLCKRLKLNCVLAEAIALAHDLGHPPFGHLGEKAMSIVHKEFNKEHATDPLSDFMHEAQSLRVIDYFKNSLHEEPLNLTLEVRDGVVCHWGEPNEPTLKPEYDKNIKLVEPEAARCGKPATLEGCVVRMADSISYLGRDFEDACMAGLIAQTDLPPDILGVLGDTNSKIIGALINDLIDNSRDKGYLKYSDRIYRALVRMKKFNYSKIYGSKELIGQEERIFLILNELFCYFIKLLNDDELFEAKANNHDYYCRVFAVFLKDMKYPKEANQGQIASDFVTGMTDNFAMNCFEDLFTIQRVI